MGIFRRTLTFPAPAVTGLAQFLVTGFGSEPVKCVIVRACSAVAESVPASGANWSIGGSDGAKTIFVRSRAEDLASSPAVSKSSENLTGQIVHVLDNAGATLVDADFAQFVAGGVELDFQAVAGFPETLLQITFLGGDDAFFDVHSSDTSLGDDVITGLAFAPVFWAAFSCGGTIRGNSSSNTFPSIGFAGLSAGGVITQAAACSHHLDASNPTEGAAIYEEGWIGAKVGKASDAVDTLSRTRISASTSSGYTINRSGTLSDDLLFVAFGFTTPKTCSAGLHTLPLTAAPFTRQVSDPGHTTELLFLAWLRTTAKDDTGGDEIDRGADASGIGMGIASDQNDDEHSFHERFRVGVNPAAAQVRMDPEVLVMPNNDGSLGTGAVRGSWAGPFVGGFALDFNLNDTATARRFVWGSIGDGYVLKPTPAVLTTSSPTQTADVAGYLVPAPVGLLLNVQLPSISAPTEQTPAPAVLLLTAPAAFTGFILPTPVVLNLSTPNVKLQAPALPPAPPPALGDDYLAQLQNLLPPGKSFTRAAGATLTKVLRAWGTEFGNVELRGQELLLESDPRSSLELLGEWEDFLGLPDPCLTKRPTAVALRRFAAVSRLTSEGGQSRAFYVSLALSLGYKITVEDVEEFGPFRVGEGRIGDRFFGSEWSFVWRVHAPEHTAFFFRAGESVAGDPLMTFGNEALTCTLERVMPAHTKVLFAFDKKFDGYAPWETIVPAPAVLRIAAPGVVRFTS